MSLCLTNLPIDIDEHALPTSSACEWKQKPPEVRYFPTEPDESEGETMATNMRQLFGMASLAILLASPSAGSAQTGRAWVDPPSDGASQPQATPSSTSQPSQPAAAHTSAPKPSSSPEQTASSPTVAPAAKLEQAGKSTGNVQPQSSSVAPRPKTAIKQQTSRRSVAERRTRVPSQESASLRKGQERMSVARQNSVRAPRYETAQDGIDAGLEVMRLRTIEFPDGRRITILTKPDPGFLSQAADPY